MIFYFSVSAFDDGDDTAYTSGEFESLLHAISLIILGGDLFFLSADAYFLSSIATPPYVISMSQIIIDFCLLNNPSSLSIS